jgi:hypothetical protein
MQQIKRGANEKRSDWMQMKRGVTQESKLKKRSKSWQMKDEQQAVNEKRSK